jgi:hypothetical protein
MQQATQKGAELLAKFRSKHLGGEGLLEDLGYISFDNIKVDFTVLW